MHEAKNLIESFTGLLIFEVAGRDYCVNDAVVVSTLRPALALSLYSGPQDTDQQFLTLNDKKIPLISLKNILSPQAEESIQSGRSRVIIIEDKEEQYGLLVDKIKEIIALDLKYIADCIKFKPFVNLPGDTVAYRFLEGSIEIDKRCLLLLNTKLVVDNFILHLS